MTWKRASLFVALAVVVGLLIVAGCASSPAAQPSPSPSAKASASTAASSPAAASPSASAAAQPPKTFAELAVYRGPDRQKLLEEGARKEGKLSWYTSDVGDAIQGLMDGFKAKYPFIQPEFFRADVNNLGTKAMQEAQANQQAFDVLSTQPQTVGPLTEAGLFMPFWSPGLASVPDQMKTIVAGGNAMGAGIRVSYVGFGYNASLIPENLVPKKFEDLMNPALTGKLAVAGSSTGQRWLGLVMKAMGEEKGKKFLEDFASKQKVSVQQISGGALLDLVAKGEVPGSPTIFREHVEQAASKGGTTKWIPMELVTANVNLAALAAKAPHPHAALLYLDFLISDDGGRAIYKKHFTTTGSEKENFQMWVPEQGRTPAQMEADVKLWDTMFKNLFMR